MADNYYERKLREAGLLESVSKTKPAVTRKSKAPAYWQGKYMEDPRPVDEHGRRLIGSYKDSVTGTTKFVYDDEIPSTLIDVGCDDQSGDLLIADS